MDNQTFGKGFEIKKKCPVFRSYYASGKCFGECGTTILTCVRMLKNTISPWSFRKKNTHLTAVRAALAKRYIPDEESFPAGSGVLSPVYQQQAGTMQVF
jgi:hypothetical protein